MHTHNNDTLLNKRLYIPSLPDVRLKVLHNETDQQVPIVQ